MEWADYSTNVLFCASFAQTVIITFGHFRRTTEKWMYWAAQPPNTSIFRFLSVAGGGDEPPVRPLNRLRVFAAHDTL
jgi:hypothetical protein